MLSKSVMLCCALVCLLASEALGHGMVVNPANRMSRWRNDWQAPANYDDNSQFCGGYKVQWEQNGGKCGMCGDNYADKTPRWSELGGSEFGTGVITGNYKSGGTLPVTTTITANHMGYFTFNLCNLDRHLMETDDCYAEHKLRIVGGDEKFYLNSSKGGNYITNLQLPTNLECKHCVLQWTYNTGNSYGACANGAIELGCGAQEQFRTCSDISISS